MEVSLVFQVLEFLQLLQQIKAAVEVEDLVVEALEELV